MIRKDKYRFPHLAILTILKTIRRADLQLSTNPKIVQSLCSFSRFFRFFSINEVQSANGLRS